MSSLLDAISKPKEMVKYCKEQGYRAVSVTDHGVISNHVQIFKECKKAGLKPLLGIEAYICDMPATVKSSENRHNSHLVLLSKNLKGWKNMIKFVSETNKPAHFYYKPRACFGMLKEFLGDGNTIAISGHPGSSLGEVLWTDSKVYRCKSVEEARQYLKPDWKQVAIDSIEKHIEVFGVENFFVEIQLIDEKHLPMCRLAAECLREIVKESEGRYRPVATADSHYIRKSDAIYQRILLCSSLGRTLPKVMKAIRSGEDVPLGTFFVSDNYHIPTFDEMQALHTEEELNNSVLIADMCEDYNILSKPKLPHFICPNGHTQISYLKELCQNGWTKKLENKGVIKEDDKREIYRARLEQELDLIEETDLAGYFLIVWDIINYCHSKGWMTGVGRGSVGGSLIAFLTGITGIDPIPYDLLFERFMNPGRTKKGKFPDIDMDIPSEHRDEIIAYIIEKYGVEYVSQMATFGSLMGRSALKEVLRIEEAASFAEMNEITEWIPDQAQIADELEQTGEESIIRWALTNRADKLAQWCVLNEDGTLEGPLAEYFAKAIVIEGTHKSQGKHAAGVIISSEPMTECCPMVRDKDGEPVAGLEMGDLESIGLIKFDVLGLSLLTKLMAIKPFLPDGKDMDDLEDRETWQTLSDGDVKGIFQLELQKRWTKKLKPENIHHLAALVSIIRPGVTESMENGKSMTQHYIDRKNLIADVPSIHPIVDECLKKTYNVIVYQENAMLLAKEVAAFNLEQADDLRNAIGKKLTDVMAQVKIEFMDGAKKAGLVDEETCIKIFDWIEKSQRYAFNASHAYAYGQNAYYTAYCKTHAPLRFYEVCLNLSDSKKDKQIEIKELVQDARLHHIDVSAPALDNFYQDFTMHEHNVISFGISHIKDVGTTESKKLFALKKTLKDDFSSLSWIEILLKFRKINSKAMKALISSGALNGPVNKTSRNQMIYEYDSFKNLTDKEIEFIEKTYDPSMNFLFHMDMLVKNHKIGAARLKTVLGVLESLKNPMYNLIDSPGWIAQTEKFYMGICLTPVHIESGDTSMVDTSCREILSGDARGQVTIGITVTELYEHAVKRGKTAGQLMGFVTGDDGTSELNSIIAFPEQFKKFRHLLLVGNSIIVEGKVQTKDGEVSLLIDNVTQV
jgi:DNA polymerase-3 subunit alpha